MMADVRERLAKHLYPSALDLSPEGVVALRIGNASPLVWQIADDVLTITISPEPPMVFSLNQTIGELAVALEAAGVDVHYANPDILGRGAGSLISGRGDSANDRLVAFQSNLWALLDAYGVEVRDANINLEEALLQLSLKTARGEFLDFWGEFFAVPRRVGEDHEAYADRIVAEVLRPRNNAYAIQNTIRELTGKMVTLREPWREIFTLDVSALSDTDHFQDGSFFTWNVFQPIFHSAVSPSERLEIIDIINRNRPAGCMMVGEFSQPPIAYADYNFHPSGTLKKTLIYASGDSHFRTDVLSSSLALSDGLEDLGSVFQWTLSGLVRLTFSADAPLNIVGNSHWNDHIWGDFSWGSPSISMVVTKKYS